MDTTANWATTRIARNTITRTHVHTGMSENRISTQSEALSGTSTGSGAKYSESFNDALLLVWLWSSASAHTRTRERVACGLCLCSGVTLDELTAFIGNERSNVWRYLRRFELAGQLDVVVRGKNVVYHSTKHVRRYVEELAVNIRRDGTARLIRGRGLKCARRVDVDVLLSLLGEKPRDK